jgi:hypothetical protein
VTLAERVGQGEPVGVLAYAGADPVGWCSIAPRARRHGLRAGLLDAACGYAAGAAPPRLPRQPARPGAAGSC